MHRNWPANLRRGVGVSQSTALYVARNSRPLPGASTAPIAAARLLGASVLKRPASHRLPMSQLEASRPVHGGYPCGYVSYCLNLRHRQCFQLRTLEGLVGTIIPMLPRSLCATRAWPRPCDACGVDKVQNLYRRAML